MAMALRRQRECQREVVGSPCQRGMAGTAKLAARACPLAVTWPVREGGLRGGRSGSAPYPLQSRQPAPRPGPRGGAWPLALTRRALPALQRASRPSRERMSPTCPTCATRAHVCFTRPVVSTAPCRAPCAATGYDPSPHVPRCVVYCCLRATHRQGSPPRPLRAPKAATAPGLTARQTPPRRPPRLTLGTCYAPCLGETRET